VAGGIGRGEAMASYLEMGAVGVQLGTRFACAVESIAHPAFKQAFFRGNARDAVASVQVDPRLPVIPVRALKNKGTEEFTAKQIEVAKLLDSGAVEMAAAQLQIEHFWAGALRRAVIDGDVENGSLMAGQSVGFVKAEQPVAEIMVVNRHVAVMREEHSTVKDGVIATSERKYHEPRDINWLRDIAEMLGEDTTTPGEFEAARIWEPIEQDTSHFVYEGDWIGLWGYPDPAIQMPTDVNDFQGFLVWLKNGSSSVVLEWENGLKGEAIWNPNRPNYNSPNGGHFIVGASRGSSGRWKQTWKEWFGTQSRALAEQQVQGVIDDAKDTGINWFLKREGITLPSIPNAVSTFFMIFNLSAGDTVYDDLVYVQLESEVFISASGGELKLFTVAGSPKLVDPARNINVTVKPGQMVTVKPGSVSAVSSFSTADLLKTQEPAAASQVRPRKPDAGQGRTASVDIPQFNANVVKFEFFESADPPLLLEERRFTNSFDSNTARFIFWHLELDYPARDSNTTFDLETVWYGPDGREYGRWSKKFRMDAGW